MILRHPVPSEPYILQTDASDRAISAILGQKDTNGEIGIISIAHRILKAAERSYFTTEKELLAVVWGLSKFRTYVAGAKIRAITDHRALTFMSTCRFVSQRLSRWILSIQDYDIEAEHCPGSRNVAADVISRLHEYEAAPGHPAPHDASIETMLARAPSNEIKRAMKKLDERQREDEDLRRIITETTEQGEGKYRIREGILHKKINEDEWRIYLPRALLEKLTWECHELYAHVGPEKIYQMLREEFCHSRMRTRIKQMLAKCDSCQRNKWTNQTAYAAMQTIQTSRPGELVSIYFLGPLPRARNGARYLLVAIDAFSKYVNLYPLRRATTEETIRKMFQEYIPKMGKPERIQFDHGTQFTARKWTNKLRECANIVGTFSSIRHPQGNIVERVNRELGRFFRTLIGERHTEWTHWIKVITDCINEVYHKTTEMTPIELHFGVKPERIWKRWLSTNDATGGGPDAAAQARRLELAKRRIRNKGRTRARKFDETHKLTTFNEGELVLVKALNVSNAASGQMAKFLSVVEGPYRIKRRVGDGTYILCEREGGREKGMHHSTRLRKYIEERD